MRRIIIDALRDVNNYYLNGALHCLFFFTPIPENKPKFQSGASKCLKSGAANRLCLGPIAWAFAAGIRSITQVTDINLNIFLGRALKNLQIENDGETCLAVLGMMV